MLLLSSSLLVLLHMAKPKPHHLRSLEGKKHLPTLELSTPPVLIQLPSLDPSSLSQGTFSSLDIGRTHLTRPKKSVDQVLAHAIQDIGECIKLDIAL
jgi:hypothetical protein